MDRFGICNKHSFIGLFDGVRAPVRCDGECVLKAVGKKSQSRMSFLNWIAKTNAMNSKFVLSGPFLLFDSVATEQ